MITLTETATCLGAFQVTIYDRFGELSVTNFGSELTCDQAKEMAKGPESDSEEGS